MSSQNCAVILAAGQGKRMKFNGPKVLCEVLFRPMLAWVYESIKMSGLTDSCIVIGHAGEAVKSFMEQEYMGDAVQFAVQTERLGTGHAVAMAKEFLLEHVGANTLILCGDAPFMDAETIKASLAYHTENGCKATVISAQVEDPTGYGRILRENGVFTAIVEQKDAAPEQLAIKEVNSGAYWFDTQALLGTLGKIGNDNAQGEYYLPDALSILLKEGEKVGCYQAASADVVLGANDRRTLLKLNQIANVRNIDALLEEGVELLSTDGVLIAQGTKVGGGTRILPGTILKPGVTIGKNCVIGPNTLIEKSEIGDGVTLNSVQCYESTVADGARIGPFVQLRPNSHIGKNVKIGDFVEVKNSTIGERTSVAHLTYVGDSDVGSHVNFGCGVVTVNYDGIHKHRTTIGDNAFIGCNTNLIAPVKVGNGAYTAAGTTVTKDVPDEALAIERAPFSIKEKWASNKLKK